MTLEHNKSSLAMNFLPVTILKSLFNIMCVGATIGMIAFWLCEYIKDNDLCLVDYTDYAKNIKGSAYPTASLCFVDPISTELRDELENKIPPSPNHRQMWLRSGR